MTLNQVSWFLPVRLDQLHRRGESPCLVSARSLGMAVAFGDNLLPPG